MNRLSKLAALLALSIGTMASANATVIATYNAGGYMQSGSVTNQNISAITQVTIDFVVDAGGGTPVWDTNNGATVGSPAATFTNLVPGTTDDYFTSTWSGLNIAALGGIFSYSGLDYDTYFNPSVGGGGAPLDGSEIMTLLFADGTSVSANLPVMNSISGGFTLTFDDSNLTRGNAVPEPFTMALFGLGLVGLGFNRKKRA